jgi:hypothetical protein
MPILAIDIILITPIFLVIGYIGVRLIRGGG